MLTTFKGFFWIKKYKDKLYSGITKRYLYTPIKKLFKDYYLTIYYKKNVQYYNIKSIDFLKKYVTIRVLKQNKDKTITIKPYSHLKTYKKTLLLQCLSNQDNSYIACPESVLKLIKAGFIEFYSFDKESVADIYRNKDDYWYILCNNNLHRLPSLALTNIDEVREYINDNRKEKKPEDGYLRSIEKQKVKDKIEKNQKLKDRFKNKL